MVRGQEQPYPGLNVAPAVPHGQGAGTAVTDERAEGAGSAGQGGSPSSLCWDGTPLAAVSGE